jgi:hypothetical protein
VLADNSLFALACRMHAVHAEGEVMVVRAGCRAREEVSVSQVPVAHQTVMK